MLIYLDDHTASLLITLLSKYTDKTEINDIYNQIKEGIERDYGKRVG